MPQLPQKLSLLWRPAVVVLTPLLLLPVALVWTNEQHPLAPRLAYVIGVMAVYWVSEALPLTVTALLPLVAFPLLGITPAKTVATQYLSDSSWLFSGGLIVAVAVEQVNLHRRIALSILKVTGAMPGRLMLGIMISCALLSMFISNTATTAMMVPVVMSIGAELILASRRLQQVAPAELELQHMPPPPPLPAVNKSAAVRELMQMDRLAADELNMMRALLLATAYSASLGGTATLTGTLPNTVMKGLLDEAYGQAHPVNYASWMGYNFPGSTFGPQLVKLGSSKPLDEGMVINIVQAWLWLQLRFFGIQQTLATYNCCARSTAAQAETLAMTIKSFFRASSLTCSYTYGTAASYVSDATVIIGVVLVLFIWPKRLDWQARRWEPLLTWRETEANFPWGVILLLGGGFAIAAAAKTTGLSDMCAQLLSSLDVSSGVLCLVSLVLMTHLTEVTSNTATSQLVLPITMRLAERRCIHPLYLTLPVTEAASFAYMLPVATPPNAIVFSSGLLRVVDMIGAGFVMNFLCMLEVLLSIHTWGWAMFQLGTYPTWAANYTSCVAGLGTTTAMPNSTDAIYT